MGARRSNQSHPGLEAAGRTARDCKGRRRRRPWIPCTSTHESPAALFSPPAPSTCIFTAGFWPNRFNSRRPARLRLSPRPRKPAVSRRNIVNSLAAPPRALARYHLAPSAQPTVTQTHANRCATANHDYNPPVGFAAWCIGAVSDGTVARLFATHCPYQPQETLLNNERPASWTP